MRHHILLVALVCVGVGSELGAQTSARDAQAERVFENQLAAIAPHELPDFEAGTRAYDAGDLSQAEWRYRLVIAAAPEFTPAMRRLGSILIRRDQRQEGLALLSRALGLERSPENLITMAQAIAYPAPGRQGSALDMARALALDREAVGKLGARRDPSYLFFHAGVAMSLQDPVELQVAVNELQRTYPEEAATHYFAAVLHAAEAEWTEAEDEIHAAERRGFSHEEAAAFLRTGVSTRARVSRLIDTGAWLVLGWAIGLLALFLAGRGLSAATLRFIHSSDSGEVASTPQRSLRRVYRALIRTAAIYYYISLPFVALLVVGAAAGVFYLFELIGRIPLQIAAAVGLGAIVTLYRMVHSLFVRVPSRDPGRCLAAAEAPGLWTLTRSVADTVGTRAIDDIRVTPGTELAVYEQGTARERRHDQARRTLILGVGLLNGFSQGAFRAVLAHEYGHFAHRDTAGGDQALRVSQDMMKFAIAMARSGQAVWWNVAFQFLRLYNFLFRRISHGATRLQEVLADRIAAHKYGAAQFEQGLRHVIRATIEFDAAATAEIRDALSTQRPCRNLYTLVPHRSDDLEHRVQDAIERATTEDDTHPGPLERFRLISALPQKSDADEAGLLWDLFADREGLTKEMTSAIEENVRLSVVATV